MGLNKQSELKERRATQALSEVMLTVLAGTRVIRYKKRTNFDFYDIWQKYSKYFRIVACFSFHVFACYHVIVSQVILYFSLRNS